ncbi:flagellar export protein FliJ [Thaumasiovibrio subtropicus]|uniref:flagellar export protein FliJ n=1 Tax=Thaumasiovibrio subtropicus TaxID=1891207 RepID=UPI000B362B33|nr:flagellar export protein FliJ [Thaumasiovibrio subtropicus]
MADNALQLILERAEQDERDALLAVERAKVELANYHEQVAQIEQYRLDYFSQMTARGQAGLTASEYSHLQRFINQLDETLAKQKLAGAHFEEQVVECQAAFEEKRQQKRSVEWLLEKKQAEKNKLAQQREQRQMDEFANLQAARKIMMR